MKLLRFFSGISILVLNFLAMSPAMINAQTRKALLIGINNYVPGIQTDKTRGSEWFNLDGCLNDLDAMRSLLIVHYGFPDKNIVVLKEKEASRRNILNNLDLLGKEAKKGDTVFIYYSGHGSQVKNSLSVEQDKLDEAIVPSDAAEGAPYIRDKELGPLFNKILDNGAMLTLVFDCCHSGSLTRGQPENVLPKSRYLPMDTVDIKDPTQIEIPAALKGALIFSACQDFELASELVNDDMQPQGAFTYAFIKALNQSQYEESAENVLLRTSAILKNRGKSQVPGIEGKNERLGLTLFGSKPDQKKNKIFIPVLKIDDRHNIIALNGGTAVNLSDSSELVKKGSTSVRIKILKVKGLTSSDAKCISNNIAEIKPGDLFEVVKWGLPGRPDMLVYSPPEKFSYNQLLDQAKKLKQFASDQKIRWINDPTSILADYVVFFSDKGWQMIDSNRVIRNLGNTINLIDLKKIIHGKNHSLFLQLPSFSGLLSKIEIGETSKNSAICYSDASKATYYLVGHLGDQGLEYAWVAPGKFDSDTSYQTTLPVRTSWQLVINQTDSLISSGDSLTLWASKLCKINAWLNLDPPVSEGSYPYHLELKNSVLGNCKSRGKVVNGEIYGLVLKTDPNGRTNWDNEPRWIYVFSIDKQGTMHLLFPSDENIENCLPAKGQGWQEEIQLGKKRLFNVTYPFGLDSYFLITSAEPISNAQMIFNCSGVRAVTKGSLSPLSDMFLNLGAAQMRGNSLVPTNWSLERVQFLSVGK
jgi:hypothetical protein